MPAVAIDSVSLHALLTSPNGPVMRDLLRRGNTVANRARALCPVKSGRLRGSITMEPVATAAGPAVRVGTNVDYARFVHDGTGEHGPLGRRIQMPPGKVMRWREDGGFASPSARGEGFVFATSSAGMVGRPFLRDALTAAGE